MKINNYFSFIALLILILLQLQSCFSRISEQECPNYLNNSAINLFYENLKIAIDAKNTTFLVDNYLESELNAISTRFTELYKNADEKKSIQSFHDSIHDELYNDFISYFEQKENLIVLLLISFFYSAIESQGMLILHLT